MIGRIGYPGGRRAERKRRSQRQIERHMLNSKGFKQTIQAIEALGAMPAVLVKVANLVREPDTDIEAIAEVLRQDGLLAADIIRISNSPYYAPPSVHSNLSSAIGYIGLREVTRVVNLSLSRQIFARDLGSYGIPAGEYWSASVAAALVMEALALDWPVGITPEDAYTVGILHAVGRVLINRALEENGFSIYWDGQQPIEDWERGAVGYDFAEAGAMLLEHWGFPAATCDHIAGQLLPGPAVETKSPLGALQFTRRLLRLTGLQFENPEWRHPEADSFVLALGVTAEFLTRLVADCREDFLKIQLAVDRK